MAFIAEENCRTTLTLEWSRVNDPYLLYIKDSATPGVYSSIGEESSATTKYVIAWKDSRGEFEPQELEDGLLEILMPGYLIRKAQHGKEDDVKRESTRRKNPETCGWITFTPPPFASMDF